MSEELRMGLERERLLCEREIDVLKGRAGRKVIKKGMEEEEV